MTGEFQSTASTSACAADADGAACPAARIFVEGRMPNEERNDDPLSLLREACEDVIKTLPKDRRRTPECLDSDAIAGGLLEALLGFPRSDTDEAIRRCAENILARARADGQM